MGDHTKQQAWWARVHRVTPVEALVSGDLDREKRDHGHVAVIADGRKLILPGSLVFSSHRDAMTKSWEISHGEEDDGRGDRF